MKIILLGYMGSGKSVIGKSLSKTMHLPFLDLDQYIQDKEKLSINAIFEQKGEIYFRKIEHHYLKELVALDKKFILSLGGGTPCYGSNMELILASDAISIYLQASVKTLLERLDHGKSKRPLIAQLSNEELTEFIAKHLFERSFHYQQAHKKIKVDHKTLDEICTEIRILLH
jgi:shikimate kinase